MKNIFKFASLLMAAAMLFACSGQDPDDNGDDITGDKLVLTADKSIIQTFGGDFATLTVTLGEEVITEDVTFFDGNNKVIEIPDFKFSTTKSGEYQIIASYGTYISEPITITAISVEIPATPADPKPGSTDFKARVLVSQFTTTGCGPCAGMKGLLHSALEDEEGNPMPLADKLVLTTCHSGTMNGVADPAYVKTDYDDFCKTNGFPYVTCDMYYSFMYYPAWGANTITGEFDKVYNHKKDVAAGIAVTSSVVDGQLVAKVTIKAAVDGNYRIGAFLLEDGIYGKQNNASAEWMNVHDGVVRYIDSKDKKNQQYYGHTVGRVEKGMTTDYMFVWDLNQIWDDGTDACEVYAGTSWGNSKDNEATQTVKKGKAEFVAGKDLHMAVFASTVGTDLDGNEIYYVNNVVDCPVIGETPYQYK